MKKTIQIFNIEWRNIRLSCKYMTGKTNPYRLYKHEWYRSDDCEWPKEHKLQIASYADLTSVMYHVYKLTHASEYGGKV